MVPSPAPSLRGRSPSRSMKRERTPAAARVADGLLASRRALPIWSAQQELLREVASSPTLILTGDTGCGKTTQIPQFLHAAGYSARGIIGITQPRRVAAMSVAQRVAAEMGTQVGELVGYCGRFDDRSGPRTRIRYVTDGMLLREAMGDPLLSRYSVLIVDEAHERSLQTDVVLAILKAAQAARALKEPPAEAEPPTTPAEPGATSITPRAKGAARRSLRLARNVHRGQAGPPADDGGFCAAVLARRRRPTEPGGGQEHRAGALRAARPER